MPNKSNAELQAFRMSQNKTSLLAKLDRLLFEYAQSECTDTECAIRDALTDIRHLCDINQLSYADIDRRSLQGYTEELSWRSEEGES